MRWLLLFWLIMLIVHAKLVMIFVVALVLGYRQSWRGLLISGAVTMLSGASLLRCLP